MGADLLSGEGRRGTNGRRAADEIPSSPGRIYVIETWSPESTTPENGKEREVSTSIPVVVLTALGALIAILGFIVGGNALWVIIGLAAVAVAGILQVVGRDRTRQDEGETTEDRQ